MQKTENSLLKIYASTTDKSDSKLFYEFVVYAAKDFGISGVTVHRGIMGYGLSSKISSSKFWELTEKLPVVIELVDKRENLVKFYQHIHNEIEQMPKGCLVTLSPISVILHKTGKSSSEQ